MDTPPPSPIPSGRFRYDPGRKDTAIPTIDLKSLVGRLGDVSRRTLEAAAGQTLSRTHYNVEIEHWLLQMLAVERSDIAILANALEIGADRIAVGLGSALDRMTTGNGRAPGLSPDIIAVIKDAWLFASIEAEQSSVRSGHILWAALSDERIAARLTAAVPVLRRLVPDVLRRDLPQLVAGGVEAPSPGAEAAPPPAAVGTTALDRYTVDLTAQARAGRIDPILGRDGEIRRVIDILTRRRQNNPIMTGEAGVGKTAVVEGLAQRIADGDVPPPLASASIRTLDLGLLQAGAGVKGEFENRLRSVIDEAQSSAHSVILFVDEAHTLIGAGGAPGQGDAANLLKPPLARGELRVIAATTWAEYKKYIEKDAALARRFQPVKIDEPSENVAVGMVRGLVPSLERHHGVRILDEAVTASVHLSTRYIQGRQLPDKAVSLIDTACARVAMSQAATPPALEDRRRRLAAIAAEARALEREERSGASHEARLAALEDERMRLGDEVASLDLRWAEERRLAASLAELRAAAETETVPISRTDLLDVASRLAAVQGEHPMVFPVVDAQAVAEIVANWTGIPTGRMRTHEIASVLTLREALARRVVGQDHALDAVSRAVMMSRAGLTDPRKPVGVFLMVGTSGVGKTETALALADILYGGEQTVTTINMSEFKEEHKVSLLMGSPPGYVGYGEGGVLTEAVRRRPHGVLLLDEFEKAHTGVQEIFFQVFDKGTMKDGEGRDVDFRNTIIIMTSNAGSALIEKLFADPATSPDVSGLTDAMRAEMGNHFKPAFLGRVSLVPYLPLGPDTLRTIVGLQFARVARRIEQGSRAVTHVSDAATDAVIAHARNSSAGARSVEAFLASRILPDLSASILSRMADGPPITEVSIEVVEDGSIECRLT